MTAPQLVVLDWRHCKVGPRRPCVLCGRPAHLRSPRGEPCHKTCAEAWLEQRAADASARYTSDDLYGGQ